MDRNLVIIGMRGVGKTTFAKALSLSLGREMIDTDHLIQEMYGEQPINEIYRRIGEKKFRLVEHQVLSALQSKVSLIISTGGGITLTEANRTMIESLGLVICLNLPKQELLTRWGRLPVFAPKLESFENWYEERMKCLRQVKAVWLDPREPFSLEIMR